ncbi:MerR family transcriptional regulator [Neobacillus cucumis]|uniref:MerR family transcriptional regulator n=1 Tax=Neobacillus cucumis TaxID=1740721 RepID=UPI0018DFF140|nr:MerR family transcriptional regulator [Neobacillus cucumis]MBI0575827.1 MerR family transcriptional regulator [Neobacillus cucumis]
MKAYTIKEAAKEINISHGIIRKWVKEFDGLLDIPRTKQGARIYTEAEIELFQEIKQRFANKESKESVREWLLIRHEPVIETISEPEEVTVPMDSNPLDNNLNPVSNPDESESPENQEISLELVSSPEPEAAIATQELIKNAELFFEAMDTYKQTFLSEVKDEIRSVVRKEVLDEVKKEISNGAMLTVKSLSNSIYKSTENTKEEIKELSAAIEKNSEQTTDSLKYLSNSIANVTIETTEEIYSLSKQVAETSEGLSHYMDITNEEISNLTEAITKEREVLLEEREYLSREIIKREAAFQNMLTSFRDVAATKEKKWWKFWS